MLELFRKAMKSKFGVAFALVFLILIVVAFGLSDVANSGAFGGVSGGDRVAVVGKTKISTSDLSTQATASLERIKQQSPTYSMEAFLADDGLNKALDQMIDRAAIAEYGRKLGLRAGSRLVDSELVQIPAFYGSDGKFDEKTYQAALRQQGLSDELVRTDIAQGLFARQLLTPVTLGTGLPTPLVKRYAELLKESRKGQIALLPSDAYAPKDKPTEAQLRSYYDTHKDNYIRPERRVIRYAIFGEDALGTIAKPTDAEIADRYKRDQSQYVETENRTFTQLIVPTKPAADAVIAEVKGGKSLEDAAKEKGLTAIRVGPFTQDQFASSATQAVSAAGFAAKQGQLAEPAKGALGYYILRVDKVEHRAGKTLEQAKPEIEQQLITEKRSKALADMTGAIEDAFDNGDSLTEVADTYKIKLETTPDVLADGTFYGDPAKTVPPALKQMLSTAFSMDEGAPQIGVVVPGITYVVYDVSKITPSAVAPFAELKDKLEEPWRRAEGAKAAKAAADRVMQRLAAGKTLDEAMAEEKKPLPKPDQIDMSRDQLSAMGQRVPGVLALMFSMAQNTVKRLEAPNDNGWFVVRLSEIKPGDVADNDPMLAKAQAELKPVVSDELVSQFSRALRSEVGVDKNETAIASVKTQLGGKAN